jgi:organic radical activating enzyme
MSNEQRIEILKDKVIKINSVSPSFCTAKWLQTTVYLQNGYNHSCHHPSPHKIPINEVLLNPKALHNSQHKKKQRQDMLSGVRPKECQYCWNIEDLNKDYFSDRHYKTSDYWAWDRFDEVANSIASDDTDPSYLEVSFSNACNFKCAYCSPEISSKWQEEIQQHGPYPGGIGSLDWLKTTGRYPYAHKEDNPYVNAFWEWFPEIYKSLKVFRITGGEPLMSKDTWKVLDWIIENPNLNLELAINSNLYNDDKLISKFIEKLNLLKDKVKRLTVFTSIESVGEQAEYVRFGLNYKKWLENVNLVLEKTDVELGIMTTMNILSVAQTTNLIDLIIQLRAKFNKSNDDTRIHVSFNILKWPLFLNVNLLPLEYKKQLAKSIIDLGNYWTKFNNGTVFSKIYLEELDQLNRFGEFMINPNNTEDYTSLRKQFIEFVNEYDRRKNTNFSQTFPHLKEFYDEWSKL